MSLVEISLVLDALILFLCVPDIVIFCVFKKVDLFFIQIYSSVVFLLRWR